MNRVKKVTLNGVTGQVSKSYDLQAVNMIVGPNGAGKSSLLEAIQFAARGFIGDSKLPEDTYQMASSKTMSVRVELTDGFAWTRSLTRKGDALAMSVEIDGESFAKLADAERALATKIGDFAPMWNVSEFMSLSADKKRDMLLDLASKRAGRESGSDPLSIMAQVMLEYLSLHDEHGPGTIEVWLHERHQIQPRSATFNMLKTYCDEKLSKHERDALATLMTKLREHVVGEPSAAIGAALDAAGDWTRKMSDEADAGTKAARELSEEKARLIVPAGDINAARTGLDDEIAKRESVRADAERIKGVVKAIDSIKRRIAEIDNEQAGLRQEMYAAEKAQTERDELAKIDDGDVDGVELTALRSKLSDLKIKRVQVSGGESGIVAMEAQRKHVANEMAKLNIGLAELQSQIEPCDVTVDKANETARRLEAELESHKETYRNLVAASKSASTETEKAIRDAACEACRPAVCNAMKQAGLVAPSAAEVNAARKRVEDAKSAAAAAQEVCQKAVNNFNLGVRINDAKRAIIAKTNELATIDGRLANMRSNASASVVAEIENEITQTTTMLVEADKRFNEARASALMRTNRITQLNAIIARGGDASRRLLALGTQREACDRELVAAQAENTLTVESLETEYKWRDENVEKLKRELSNWEKYQSVERAMTEAIARAESRRVAKDVGLLAQKAIKAVRETMMQSFVRPVVELMDRRLIAADPLLRAFIQLDNPTGKRTVFRMGMKMAGREIVRLSGGERAIFVAALAYALTMLADPPLKIIPIEASEMDADRQSRLMSSLVAAKDDIGTSIVATWSTALVDDDFREFQVLDLSEKAVAG